MKILVTICLWQIILSFFQLSLTLLQILIFLINLFSTIFGVHYKIDFISISFCIQQISLNLSILCYSNIFNIIFFKGCTLLTLANLYLLGFYWNWLEILLIILINKLEIFIIVYEIIIILRQLYQLRKWKADIKYPHDLLFSFFNFWIILIN